VLGAIFTRLYGLSASEIVLVFPGARPRNLDLV